MNFPHRSGDDHFVNLLLLVFFSFSAFGGSLKLESELAVVHAVKGGFCAAEAGVLAGDKVVKIHQLKSPSLAQVLEYYMDSHDVRETKIVLARGSTKIEVTLPQGNWGCEFRPDFSKGTLEALRQARGGFAAGDDEDGKGNWLAVIENTSDETNRTWLWATLGKELRERSRFEAALNAFGQVRSLLAVQQPESETFWPFWVQLEVAQTAQQLGKIGLASEAFAEARAQAEQEENQLRLARVLIAQWYFELRSGNNANSMTLSEKALSICEHHAADTLLHAEAKQIFGYAVGDQGKSEEAKRYLLEAQAIRHLLAPGGLEEAAGYHGLGYLHLASGDISAAKECYLKAISIRSLLAPGTRDLAASLNNLGSAAWNTGDHKTAYTHYLKAFEIFEILDPESLTLASNSENLGYVLTTVGDLDGACQYHFRALEIRKSMVPKSALVALSWQNLGRLYFQQRNLDAANGAFREALEITQQLESGGPGVGILLTNLGEVALQKGQLEQAQECYLKACDIWQKHRPDGLEIANVYSGLGGIATERSEFDRAHEYYSQAMQIREKLAPRALPVARSYDDLGANEARRGHPKKAKEYCLKALEIKNQIDPEGPEVSVSLINLGSILSEQGDLATARDCFLRTLSIQEQISSETWPIAVTLNNLGNIAFYLADFTAARAYYLRALRIHEGMAPDSLYVALTLNNLANLELEQGNMEQGHQYHLRAFSIRQNAAPESMEVAESLTHLGQVAWRQGNLDEAQEKLNRALEIEQRLAPGSIKEAETFIYLGEVALQQGQFDSAHACFSKALQRYQQLAPGSFAEAKCWYALARVARESGELGDAAQLSFRAVETLEAQRFRVGGQSARTSFSTVSSPFYFLSIQTQVEMNCLESAMEILERSRSRCLLEMMAGRWVDFSSQVPPELLDRQRELAQKKKGLYSALSEINENTVSSRVDELRANLLLLEYQEDALAMAVKRASPKYAALEYPEPLTYKSMKRNMEPGTLVLAFAVGENETVLFQMLKRRFRPDIIDATRLPVGRAQLEKRVLALRTRLGPSGALSSSPDLWKSFSSSFFGDLLGPAVKLIGSCKRLVIIPDGPLHLVPFSALVTPPTEEGKRVLEPIPLGVQKPILIIVSLTLYSELKKDSPQAKHREGILWTGFGDPDYPNLDEDDRRSGELALLSGRGFDLKDLPGTNREVKTIAGIFGDSSQKFLGLEATESAVRNLPPQTPYLHFACHGLIDHLLPLNSCLVLSLPEFPSKPSDSNASFNDGLLQAWEIIEDIELNSACVVLSACETGVGKIVGGEGVMGLTRAFFYAGAQSVLVSLWPIADESTAVFMEYFYTHIAAGTDRDIALQLAKHQMWKHPEYAHPYYWAAFQLHGRYD